MNEPIYYFFLEPYTFLFKGKENSFLLYNSASYHLKIFVNENEIVTRILNHLYDFENMYVIQIDTGIIESSSFKAFLSIVRDNNFGDMIQTNKSYYKPVIIPPIAYVRNSISNIKKDKELKGNNALISALREVTIYINGTCSLECEKCLDFNKQFLFCRKSKIEWSTDCLELLISNIGFFRNKTINICGGNIFKCHFLDSFLERLKNFNSKINLYIHYKNIDFHIINNPIYKEMSFILLVDNNCCNNTLLNIIDKMKRLDYRFRIHCVIDNEDSYNMITELEEIVESDIKLLPFYNNNEDFFRDNVYISYNELTTVNFSKEMIFINQLLNSNNYGKIIIFPDGSVHDSLSSDSIGNINDNSLEEIINSKLFSNSNWFKIRNNFEPCNICEFNALCPPLSSYEDIIGRNNLCVIYP